MFSDSLSSSPPSRSRQRRRAPQGGFSLLEVIMATFVMAFGISTSIISIQAGFRQLDLARGTTIAAQIVQSEMERLRMMSYANIAALPTTQTFDGATYFTSASQIANRFTITRTVSDDATHGAEMKNISVSVTWKTTDGREHTRSYTAHYAKHGLYDYYYTVAHP